MSTTTQIPKDLKYTKEHEWALVEGETLTVGITDFAQSALGDIVFLELPQKGSSLSKGQSFGVVESIKSVSDLYAPVSGEVIDVNDELIETPDIINQKPYESWLIKIKATSASEITELLDAENYDCHCEEAHN